MNLPSLSTCLTQKLVAWASPTKTLPWARPGHSDSLQCWCHECTVSTLSNLHGEGPCHEIDLNRKVQSLLTSFLKGKHTGSWSEVDGCSDLLADQTESVRSWTNSNARKVSLHETAAKKKETEDECCLPPHLSLSLSLPNTNVNWPSNQVDPALGRLRVDSPLDSIQESCIPWSLNSFTTTRLNSRSILILVRTGKHLQNTSIRRVKVSTNLWFIWHLSKVSGQSSLNIA